jgi:hypothetical protein
MTRNGMENAMINVKCSGIRGVLGTLEPTIGNLIDDDLMIGNFMDQ